MSCSLVKKYVSEELNASIKRVKDGVTGSYERSAGLYKFTRHHVPA
jgi:hypothetical protein